VKLPVFTKRGGHKASTELQNQTASQDLIIGW